MSTPSKHDGQTGKEHILRHRLNQNLAYSQMQQHHLPLQQQPFQNGNIALQQQNTVIQHPTGLTNPPLTIPSAVRNIAASSTLPAAPPATQFVHWSNPLMNSTPYLQPQQQSAPTAAPQQHQFNDFLFNIQAQAAYAAAAAVPTAQVNPATAQQETYSVFRVGNGNFWKIYHCPENGMVEASFNHLAQYNQGQAGNFHHATSQSSTTIQPSVQQQQSPNQINGNANTGNHQVFNSYELFSNNTFTQLPTAEMPPLLLLGHTDKPPAMATENFNNAEQAAGVEIANIDPYCFANNNNSGNWTSGNLHSSINSYSQFDCVQGNNESIAHTLENQIDILPNNNVSKTDLEHMPNANIGIQQQNQLQNASLSKDSISQTLPTTATTTTPALKTEIPRQEAPKKRIVAEVKPMRMTYSDVLSKFNNQAQSTQQCNLNNSSTSTTGTSSATPTLASQRNQPKTTYNASNTANNLRRIADDASGTRLLIKKSPVHENKENQNNKLNSNQKRSVSSVVNSNSNSNNSTLSTNNNICSNSNKLTTTQKNSVNPKYTFNNNANANNASETQQPKKQRLNKNSDSQNSGAKNANGNEQRGITKTNSNTSTSNSTVSSNNYNSTNNTYARKPTKSSNNNNSSSATGQQKSRYQNNSNVSYSYSSTKRSRNNSSFGTSSALSLYNSSYANNTGSNHNYEFAKRVLEAWYTYTLKILTWLFYLVYDTVVLGCSILYERLMYGYESSISYAKQLHRDLNQNSNKPSIWFKNYCRKFDAKFSKTSKWAFWRRFLKKKPPETTNESIKTGKLPATGEEAMFQLLNCKGKDAYSILGVPPNSSQEQIRKHYKKIAVLVHPDKNKQAGAEEAFKVLQRAFELIGESENRLAYDQSLAEALHAEKAWTELHDLLSQLQTKITEAANTIRCSTCGLRHPRKMTDRPHYAARECASCKIRHSSREGDIWAETSMWGLRWKYLALMEGKVYDITEWANCQKGALAHLEPNSHMVQYRIVRGAQQQQQQQQQQQHQQKHQAQQQQHHHQQQHTGSQYPGTGGVGSKFQRDNVPTSEASLHEFLDNLYSGQHPQQQQQNTSAYASSSRRRNRRN